MPRRTVSHYSMPESGAVEQLDAIAGACRQLLCEEPTPDRVASTYLHLRNAHPSSLAIYDDLRRGKFGIWTAMVNFVRSNIVKLAALQRQEPLYFGDSIPERTDILFVSHFTNAAQASGGDDRYFGHLPATLTSNGLTSVVAHINHTWATAEDILPNWSAQPNPRVIFGRTVGLRGETAIARRLSKAARQIQKSQRSSSFDRDVARHAAFNAIHTASLTALRTGLQLDALIQKLKPKILITTFEGHPWERIAFHTAHNSASPVQCIGYHHTVLFPHQHALKTRIGHGYDPDAIVCAGDIGTDWFKSQGVWGDIPVETLGSVRSPQSRVRSTPNQADTCLVAPEGILGETQRLFELAIATAKETPGQQFRLRLHPVLSRDVVLRAAPDLASLPANVTWSDCGLNEDFEKSSSVLYRGSTVAVSAVLHGLRPIYVALDTDQFVVDPLRNLTAWKTTVGSTTELRLALAQDRTSNEEFIAARDYCAKYFTPMNAEKLRKLIDVLSDGTN